MAYKVIEIPGGGTRLEDAPSVRILGASGEPVTLIIQYHARETVEGQPPLFGEITFFDVLEYRWIADFVDYEDYPEHEKDFEFGLVEIIDSKYIENMASKGPWRDFPGQRFGPGIKESSVRHFRIVFDEYGKFDIIAFEVSVRETSE